MTTKTNIPFSVYLLPIAAGLWMSACVPTTPESPDAKYNIGSYTPVQGDSGSLAGTWVLTTSKPAAAGDPWPAFKGRALFRIKPVAGNEGQLEVDYCVPNDMYFVQTAPATVDGTTVTLNVQTDSPLYITNWQTEPFTIVDNNHLEKSVVTPGGVSHVFHAVKISADPNKDIGNVSVSMPAFNKAALNQSAKCLGEIEFDNVTEKQAWLMASGTNGGGVAAAAELMTTSSPSSNTVTLDFSRGQDGTDDWGVGGEGLYGSSTNTVTSTSLAVKGTATLRVDTGALPLPVTFSKVNFNLAL